MLSAVGHHQQSAPYLLAKMLWNVSLLHKKTKVINLSLSLRTFPCTHFPKLPCHTHMGATECAIFSPGSLGKHYARNHSKIKISTCAWKLKVNTFTFTLIAAGDRSRVWHSNLESEGFLTESDSGSFSPLWDFSAVAGPRRKNSCLFSGHLQAFN